MCEEPESNAMTFDSFNKSGNLVAKKDLCLSKKNYRSNRNCTGSVGMDTIVMPMQHSS
jgi:hypothetical protein